MQSRQLRKTGDKALRGGWSLIETTIVISIITIFVGLIIPKLTAAKQDTYFKTVQSNLHNLSGAMEYHMEKYGVYPNGTNGLISTSTDSLIAADTLPVAIATQPGRLESFSVAPGISIFYISKTSSSYTARAFYTKLQNTQYCDLIVASGLQTSQINCVGQ